MRRPAFTLIELIVALAVTVVLAGVGVSRYSSFIHQQDFLSGAQQISGCLQRAQQLAVTGGVTPANQPIRYVVANVYLLAGDSGLTCTIDAYPYDSTMVSTIPLLDKAKVGTSKVADDVKGENTQMSGRFGIVFGATEHGLPLDYSVDGGSHDGAPTAVLGFPSSFQILTITGDQVTATISIAQAGTPITITNVRSN